MSVLTYILAAVGVLGVGGMIALAIFAPAIATVVLQGALAIFRRIMSTREGAAAVVGAACLLGGYVYGDSTGARRVHTEWAAANAAAAIKAANADAEAAAKAEAEDAIDAANETAADKAAEDARNAYIADLEKRAAANGKTCPAAVPDADLKRLRGIR